MKEIKFNKPYLSGKELYYISQSVQNGQTAGNRTFTGKCHEYFKSRFGFKKVLLTTSCTDALEMSAILSQIEPGDEIIMPSFTFVSTANAFILRGAKIVFVDSQSINPNLDHQAIVELITPRTKAIVVVHYAGIACEMDTILALAKKYNLLVIEDAAQAIDSYYKDAPLGSIGDFGAFSFHETKNIICGEGGMLCINNPEHHQRAEIIWEKGTNRAAFHRGEVDKYTWVDVGSSFLPSDLTAAFLFAQLENMPTIQAKRKEHWLRYYRSLVDLETSKGILLPKIPDYATNNAHMFYLVCRSLEERTALIQVLQSKGIHSVFHYLALDSSPYFSPFSDGRILENSAKYSDCLVRLPMYVELKPSDIDYITEQIINFYQDR